MASTRMPRAAAPGRPRQARRGANEGVWATHAANMFTKATQVMQATWYLEEDGWTHASTGEASKHLTSYQRHKTNDAV